MEGREGRNGGKGKDQKGYGNFLSVLVKIIYVNTKLNYFS